jgi:flagellar biogenesis protein FliO
MMDVYTGIVKVVLLSLGIVAAIILFSRYAGKLKFPLRPQSSSYGLKKVDSLYLGYKKFISVVEVKDYVLVVASGDKEMSLLAKWKKEDKTS